MPRRNARDDDPASAATELKLFLETKLQPDDYADAEKLIDAMSGAEDEETGLPRPGGAQDHRFAMDSASPGRIVADRDCAIAEVERFVGRHTVMACDSASGVFRAALGHLGVDARALPNAALPALWRITQRAATGAGGAPRPAYNARDAAAFAAKFPELARVRHV